MNAQVMIKDNTARAVEVAKAVEATAGALAEALEKKSELLGDALEKQADAIGSKTAPLAKAVEVKADALGETLEATLEKARNDAMASLKGFKFGQREAILLGVAVGALTVAVVVRRMDRKAAAERLKAAGTRAGESAQKLGAKVSPAVAAFGSKAGELAGQVKEQVTTRASGVAEQLRPSNGRHGDESQAEYALPTAPADEARAEELDEARQRLSAEASEPAPAPVASETATSDAAEAAPQGEIKVSDGMKVVAFDGTDIGRVQEVREEVFVLDRPRGADLLVPMDQVARIEGTVVYLRIETGQVSKMGWEKAGTD
jgi:hypothetical protein